MNDRSQGPDQRQPKEQSATQAEVLNAGEAAAFLGVHVQTIRKLARTGELPHFRIGTAWRFRKDALIAWADAQVTTHKRSAPSVLVIDDEVEVCTTFARMIERLGGRPRLATSAVAGLALVREELPDVILLDLIMPGMNGPEFLEELRADHPNLPVVIVTSDPDGELMRSAAHLPPVMLLPKPLESAMLERTLNAIARVQGASAR